jgi:hypothetical protein
VPALIAGEFDADQAGECPLAARVELGDGSHESIVVLHEAATRSRLGPRSRVSRPE